MTPDMHYRLALQIADQGIQQHHQEIARYVSELRRRGYRSAAIDIVVDRSQPDVARVRAFGRLPVTLDAIPEFVGSRAA